MRIALLGARGQLGSALTRHLVGQVVPLTSQSLDVADAAQVAAALERVGADLVINAAAYNLVDQAEGEPQRAYAVNALGPRHVSQWCAQRDVPLVHISTDYVFGLDFVRKAPYLESDLTGPLGAYGISKLAGELYVRALAPRHFVVRTCGLFGNSQSSGKGNFVKTMLRLGRERGAVSVVDDQWCTPTSADDLAQAIVRLIETGQYGLYHATSRGATTWCRLAQEVFHLARMPTTVTPIPSADYPTPARRPAYSVLECSKLGGLGITLPPWQEGLARYVEELEGRDG
ncbi:MAG: dTDP-4-dehydrorhamnose reductase [Planctomycetales bacterium]